MTRSLSISSAQFLATLSASVAFALVPLAAPAHAQEVVQALPEPAAEELNEALRRLSRNPESVPALVAAGRASLTLNDVDAALGFFSRAQAVEPDDTRVLIGLALVAVRRGEAVTALRLFENAAAGGVQMMPYEAEQGLAYDLVGRNARAQRLYRRALAREDNPTVRRRLALSYAISGNAEESETTLLPLLQRQDRAAYRTRAFALAILGNQQEAISIAETMLPQRLSMRLAPFLRYMPRLTPAQQAAAANQGRFPAAREIGNDSSQIAAYTDSAPAQPSATRASSASSRLAPQGEPLGPAPSAPLSNSPVAAVESSGELPPLNASPTTVAASQPAPAQPEPVVVATAAPTPAASQPSPGITTAMQSEPAFADAQDARPSFTLTETAPQPAQEQEAEQIDLAEAFADFTLESAQVPSRSGAVDITAIDPPREKPAPVKPKPPAHPARHWVQVATGQDTSAFRFDWRRIVRNAGGLLDDVDAFTAKWGQTNRLLTGPFDTARAAQERVSELAGQGVDSFRFASEEGEEIQKLD
ncbi:tetratricopeptide repeat protein [Aurantiacibacter rhizosphaerae]|uniref:Tetratricopeptide repeat protein n=1 Tax=Aurantiacibacter rhizosphaerae TaxID=2691582 RepID=A0A844XC92_9SPHN|nr:tetratricopeptide repeat protein [Aurantiacibacter rhizosphaerae]MWV27399.1 tetratricopeptide repeat protein [Aurantiacibacter rhizosphaerae]